MSEVAGARGWHYRALRTLYERVPSLARAAAAVTNTVVRGVLAPQVPVPQPARTYTNDQLTGLTDHLNERAEHYFAAQLSPEFRSFLLGKPFTDVGHFAEHLFSVGVLAHWLQLRPGDVVVELGAGSGWLSHLFHRFGCPTISLDVSPTAMGLARELFEADRHTDWSLGPRFLTYDGHTLPLGDSSADALVVYDAFHHVPNQAELLAEMHRVLRPGGMVAMSEPGRRHSLSGGSLAEVEKTGVLENDIVVEELDGLARACGFARTTIVPVSLAGSVEVDSTELVGFLRGRGFQQFWARQAQSLLSEHYILMYKGVRRPDTRRPSVTTARIEAPASLTARAGHAARLACRVTNSGDTLWRVGAPANSAHGAPANGAPGAVYGQTRLGVQLADAAGQVTDRDWHRVEMPHELGPGETAALSTDLPPLPVAGTYQLHLDVVAESVRWFADHGSEPETVHLTVEPG